MLKLTRKGFASDPFGYSAAAWHHWGTVQTLAGFPIKPKLSATSAELKDPILWLTQATALSQAAKVLLNAETSWEHMPLSARAMCDSQYCAAALMLVGYSLEVCLKGVQILRKGVHAYSSEERHFLHHRLEELGEVVPGLDAKEQAILRLLTHFVTWAGRYPDPGKKSEHSSSEVFDLSEKYQVTGRDLFALATKVMDYMQVVVNE